MAISEQGRKKWEEIKKKNEQRWAAEENNNSSVSQNARKNKAIAAANSKMASKSTVVKPNAKSVSAGKRGQSIMVTDAGEKAVQREREVAAARQKAIADAKAAANARWAAGEKGRQRITKPGASRAASGATNQPVMVSDTGTGDATAERNARKARYQAEYDALSKPVNAAYQTGKNIWDADLLDNYSRMQELSKKMKTIDLLNEYADKESGFWGSNYDLGELGELSNLAWFDAYNGAQSDADEEYARYIDNIIDSYSGNNQDSFTAKGIATENSPDWVKQLNDMAVDAVAATVQYIPQLKNQIMDSIAPALLGAYVGGRTGFNVGRSVGSAVHSYKAMSGAAYKEMRNLGLNHDAAQRLAGDEAFISSIIEFADTFLESMSHGYGKIANKLGIPSLLGDGAKRAAKTGGVAGKLIGLGKWGVNTIQEGGEEGQQEAVSIANENRALSGYTGEDESFFPRVWGLVKDAAPIWWDSTKGLFTGDADTDYTGRIWDATKGGMQVGAVMGALGMGSSYLANTILDNTVNADPRYVAVREGTAAQAQSLSDVSETTVQQHTASEEQNRRQNPQTAPAQEQEPVTPELVSPTQEERENAVASMDTILRFLGYPVEAAELEMDAMDDALTSGEIDRQSAPVREIQPGTEMPPVRTAEAVDMSGTAELQRLAAEMDQRQQAEDAVRAQQETEAFEAAQTAIYQQQNRQRWTRSRETVDQHGSGLAESAATDKWSRQDVATVDKMARQLGVKVYTENARNIGDGAGEGSITGNVVLLDESMDATEAIRRVAGHEFGHRMKDLAPKEFDIYVAAVRDAVPDFENLVERKQALMQANHLDASVAAATEEVAADYAGQLMSDGNTMEQFIQQNQHRPSLLKRMAEAFRELWRKLTGKERTQAEEAAYRLEKAYEKAVKEAKKNAARTGGGERLSIENLGGEMITVIGTRNDTRQYDVAEAYLNTLVNAEHPFSTVLRDSLPVYLGKDLPGEYRGSEYTKSMESRLRNVKMQAATNLDEMLLLADDGEWRENVKAKHAVDAKNGWYRYETQFAVQILNAQKVVDHYTVYSGTLLIRNDVDGKSYLYDLVNIAKKKVISASSFSAKTHSEVKPPKPSDANVTHPAQNVKAKFSLKEQQFQTIQQSNPAADTYHTWIRSADEIRTFEEALADPEWDYSEFDPDYTRAMAEEALRSGEITVYSSYPISEGVFVSPSRMEAESYSGSGKVYSKTVSLDDVAWIDPTQGQYAPVRTQNDASSRQSLRTDAELEAAVREIQQRREAGEISAEEARTQITALAQRAAEDNPDFAAIQKENQKLLRKVERLKKQMKLTTAKDRSVRQADTDRVANALLKDFSSRANRADIKQAVYALANKILRAKNPADVWESATVDAQAILWEVVENSAELNDTFAEEYRDIKKHLRSTPLVISETDSHDIIDLAALKKSMRGTMRISVGENGNVDRIFTDMAARWPGFFNVEATTHPADMVERIADVMDMLKPAFENPFSANMDAAVQEGANALLETLVSDAVREEAPTFADRQKAKYEEKLKNAIQKERDKRTEAVTKAYEEKLKKAIQKERDKRTEAVTKAKETGKRALQRQKQRQKQTETRAKIKRHVQTMSTRLLNPTNTKHVPTGLQASVAKLLDSINLDSGRDSENHAQRVQAMAELKAAYQKVLQNNDGDLVVNPDLLGDDSQGFVGLFDRVIAMGDKSIYEMTQSELDTVWAVVRSMETAISNAGKALANQKAQTIRGMADSFAQDISQKRPKPQTITNALRQDMMNPYSFFHQFGETATSIWRELRDAQDTQTIRIQEIAEKVQNKISPQLMKQAQKTVHTFDLESGEKLTLTNAQVMNLYNLMQRRQAQDHLMKGGVVQPEVKVGKIKVSRGTEMIPLSLRDLLQITDVLSTDEKAAAEALQALTGDLAVWGNDTSEKAYGYQKFTEKNYWPIKSAQEALHSDVEKGQNNTRSIQNIGMAKNTVPHASTAIELGDIFDVFAQHTADMIGYSTWLLPMEDVNRFFNHKYVDEAGIRTGKTVKGMLERIGGKGSQAYWMRLMEDIQNGINPTADTQAEKIANKIVGNAKGAAIGANIRVILQQPTAFARAYAVLNPLTAMHGIFSRGVTGGNGWKKAQKYSGIGLIKAIGGFDQGNARSVKQQLFGDSGFMNKINDISSAGAEAADVITWGWLWNASEWQTKKENPNLTPGSDAFYHRTSEIFTDVIEQTQVVDGILQRTQIMRSGNAFNKQASSFMGEPLTTLNLLIRSWDDMRYSTDKAERKQARGRLARSLFVVAFASVVNAAVQSVPDATRDDDKEANWWNRFLNALLGFTSEDEGLLNKGWKFVIAGNIGSNLNPAGWIPYMNDVLNMIQGFDVTRADADVISDVVKNAQDLWSAAQGDGSKQPIYVAKRLMTSVATMLGVPVKSLTRDIWSVVLTGFEAAGQWETVYELTKVLYKPEHQSNRSRYMSLLYRAKQESPEDYNKIRQDILYNGYFESTGSAARKKTPAERSREAMKKIDDGVKKLEDEAKERKEKRKK